MSLIPVSDAQQRLIALARRTEAETLPLEQCSDRTLAEDIAALRDQPFADLSAMDGYAVRSVDGNGPWRLGGESMAGIPRPDRALAEHEAMRIFTGAPLPPGADCIVLQEDVSVDGALIHLTGEESTKAGRHVRPQGSDFADGDMMLRAGTVLDPRHIGLVALAGHAVLPVHRRPRVAIISTGNELVKPGGALAPGQLPASNGLMLRAMVEQAGGTVASEVIVADNLDETVAALREGSAADIIVTSGGASVGDHDLVRPAVVTCGGTIDFWRIKMRPGKPLISGRIGDALLLGLPGNPVSAFVTGTLFLLPLIRHMAGVERPFPIAAPRPLAQPMHACGGRDDYVRGVFTEGGGVAPFPMQDSAHLAALARADCLIIRPAEAAPAIAGEIVPIIPLI